MVGHFCVLCMLLQEETKDRGAMGRGVGRYTSARGAAGPAGRQPGTRVTTNVHVSREAT